MRKKAISGVAIFKDDDGKGTEFWRVRLGKRFTGGKVLKKSFHTHKAATDWVEEQKKPKTENGAHYFELTPSQVAEAVDAYKRITKKASLTEIVDYWFKHACPLGGTRLFEAVADDFLKSREGMNCKSTTMRNYRSAAKILKEEFGAVEMHDIHKADIEDWISESDWEPRTRKNYLVTLTTIFNYAIDGDYCVANPAERVPRPILDDKPPGILTPAQALALLKAAAGCVPEIVPGIAIGLFAGLRRSEICALDWSEIDLTAKTIEVKGIKAKTRQRRIVSIQDNLCAWLNSHHRANGPAAPDVDVFGERLKHLVKGRKGTEEDPSRPAIMQEWPHNALRHSFGSYYYGKSKNENLTAAEMGNRPEMVFKHYRALVKPEDVTAYWSIRPEQVGNIVQTESKNC